MVITIEPHALEMMTNDVEQDFPNQCCGFFFGVDTADKRIIKHAYPVKNKPTFSKSTRYDVCAYNFSQAQQYAHIRNLTLLGVYRSQPRHPAVASVYDLSKAFPFYSYLIMSVYPQYGTHAKVVDIKAWKLHEDGHGFYQEPLQLVNGMMV